jgi:hypothetical protein
MTKTAFKEFVKKEKAVDSQQRSIDWEGKKLAYLKQVDTLFDEVRTYLHEFTKSKEIHIEKRTTTIEEEYIGKYEAPVLHIRLYGRHADLVPVGTNIIGTPGRVDLRGNVESIRFILADKKEKCPQVFAGISWSPIDRERVKKKADEWSQRKRDYVWKMITDPPDIRYVELDEDNFLSLLQEVLND